MHLVELLAFRSVPAAGVSLGLTRRCPLSCAHCSTNSTLTSEQHPASMFERFVDTFDAGNRPEVLAMSGGEALLRPELVRKLAERAREAGTRSTVLSGMFFANSRSIPPPIRAAIQAVDHFSASIDVFHEREVPRANVFRVLDGLLSEGKDVSLHVVGQDAGDAYLEDIISEVRKVFGGSVPMLVNAVSSFGRARAWFTRDQAGPPGEIEADPCAMAAWPVVGFDGTIVACGNDDALDSGPAHLRLGHANVDDWATIRTRSLNSSMMRAIRLFGPEYIADRFGDRGRGCDGYCQTCMKLSEQPALAQRIGQVMAKPSAAILEEQVSAMQRRAGAVAFARSHGLSRYAELVVLGAPA
jgi:pyruvate-formate lyase-activating enzyme